MERRLIEVEGIVQGVGFRPYVHRLAVAHELRGFVRNSATGVVIDVEGEREAMDEFCLRLPQSPPVLASISTMRVVQRATPHLLTSFRIAESEISSSELHIATMPPDVASCDTCVAELFDPTSRRFRYPFLTCTDCGPRFTVVRETPYDRSRTTMAAFPMCGDCQREYDDPADRRFHAESIACAACGPTLSLHTAGGTPASIRAGDVLEQVVATVRSGGIVAMKALGGFHLVCDATNDAAVARLRNRKQRPAKPFAVMVAHEAAATALCEMSPVERVALASHSRPVVLLRRRPNTVIAESVAPGMATLGVMLPSTPLHHLLLAAVDHPLVMTSGNRAGEPVVIDGVSALMTLGDIADVVLSHDRDIATRCDDSVVRVIGGIPRHVRRARGEVPRALSLPFSVRECVLAVGGHLKNTVCVAHGSRAHLSAHIGDLDGAVARDVVRQTIGALVRTVGAPPSVIAHDLHPDYASTRLAEAFAAEEGIARRVPVQHHHAHVAACLAEHGVTQPVIGVVFDGAGLGTDGAIWGGEFLVVHGARFDRAGHLAYVPLAGGDSAARRPWRSAVAHMSRLRSGVERTTAFRPPEVGETEWRLMHQLVTRPEQLQTSSVGRLFDAVASLLGLCHVARYEGEAAMALESAAGAQVARGYPITLSGGARWTADAAGIIDGVITDVARGRDRASSAAAFHGALRDLVVLGCERIREETGHDTVVLSGGVFVNALLTSIAHDALVARRFRVLLPSAVPCNDGGLSLGQAYVAACALQEESCA